MTGEITCPQCAHSFEPSARMRAEVEESVKSQLDAVTRAQEAAMLRRARELDERERLAAITLEEKLATATLAARATAEAEAEARHRARAALAIASVTEQLSEELKSAKEVAAAATAKEAAMLRRARELDERELAQSLEFERRLAAETPKIRAQAEQLATERAALDREALELRSQEQRVKNEQLEKTVEALRRQLQQGSQQLQGEAQEASLRESLLEACAFDDISDVATGTRGADLLHQVRDAQGSDCGIIIWESKRTKAWSDGWLSKLRDDQREVGAACSVIVTQTMPPGVTHFALLGSTWVCAWPYAAALAGVLRSGLIELAVARRVADRRGDKAELLYDYLIGPEFLNRVSGVVEAIAEMQADLAQEKRAMERLWKQRSKQLVRASTNLGAFYGDLRGIAGRQLLSLPQFELPGDEVADDDDAAAPAVRRR